MNVFNDYYPRPHELEIIMINQILDSRRSSNLSLDYLFKLLKDRELKSLVGDPVKRSILSQTSEDHFFYGFTNAVPSQTDRRWARQLQGSGTPLLLHACKESFHWEVVRDEDADCPPNERDYLELWFLGTDLAEKPDKCQLCGKLIPESVQAELETGFDNWIMIHLLQKLDGRV